MLVFPAAPSKRRFWTAAATCLVAAGLSCGSESAADAEIDRLTPTTVPNYEETPAVLRGRNFWNSASASLSSDDPVVNRGWSLWIGTPPIAAEQVQRASPTQIDLVIPAGLPLGPQQLVLQSPRGRRYKLDRPLVVYGPGDAGADSAGGSGGVDGGAGVGGVAVMDAGSSGSDSGAGGAGGSTDGGGTAGVDSGAGGVGTGGSSGSGGVDSGAGGSGGATGGAAGSGGTGGAATGGSAGGGAGSVAKLLSDPFQDGTGFAYVVGYQGNVLLGPSKEGTGAVRFTPDGQSPTTLPFSLPRDTNGNSSKNKSSPPYPSIGSAGCPKDTPKCGPDNEDGRGLFASGSIGGGEWLLAGGARSGGDLDYVYMTQSTGSVLHFKYVDLEKLLGGATRGISAMHVFNGRTYLGFPDTGGSRPYLVALLKTPTGSGLDASAGSDAIDLEVDSLSGLKTSGTASIDAIEDFGNRLYIANAGGWYRSTKSTPASAADEEGDWTSTTPSASAYTSIPSHLSTKTSEIEPRDRAVVAFATLNLLLYAARNTTLGPQLWRCIPTLAGLNPVCNPGAWKLIAANTTGDTRLSQFNNPNNTAISMLVVAEGSLFVGFDNAAQGLVVFRSNDWSPSTRADFEGEGGCSAEQHPASCTGLGMNGFGSAARSRILDAKAIRFGSTTYPYLVVGNGVAPLDVFRITP